DAKAARARIDAGMTFDALAAARKLSAKTIDMGTVAKTEIANPDIANAVFSLTEKAVSQPVKGPFGYVLIRLRAIVPGVNKSFDDVKADLEKQVKTELAVSSIDDIVNKFTDEQGGGGDIATA